MSPEADRIGRWLTRVASWEPQEVRGRVMRVTGLLVESSGPPAAVGEICHLVMGGVSASPAEVVGFRDGRTLLMPLGTLDGIRPGFDVVTTGRPLSVPGGAQVLGRVLDGLGRPLDDRGPLPESNIRPVLADPPHPLRRPRITEQLPTGIRAWDGLLALGRGQRMGIFSGSGVGKSVLMGMLARHCRVDCAVICLIGERGREVREFLERDLGAEGMARSAVVVATSDQPAVVRTRAAFVATTIAESLRDQGRHVLLMMDSVTRLAMAQREIGLAVGESPATRGYTPSVFALLPRILERAGTSERGSITGLYTVLVEGGDLDEPVADALRSILDGHVVLSRKLANRGHYPSIDVLGSISRCMLDIARNDHRAWARTLTAAMALVSEHQDMVDLGAYRKGSLPALDRALSVRGAWDEFLRQDRNDGTPLQVTLDRLRVLAHRLDPPRSEP